MSVRQDDCLTSLTKEYSFNVCQHFIVNIQSIDYECFFPDALRNVLD